MTNKKLQTIEQVVTWQLCMGCGACVWACPQKSISLIDILDQGLRPTVDKQKCQTCGLCLKVCPGIELLHNPFPTETIQQLRKSWGPVLEMWEGYAADPEIRFKAASGGATSALALFCLQHTQMTGALQIRAKPKACWQNVPFFSRNRDDLLSCTGSRYSPAAPCQKLDWIEQADGNCVFIGKPCDIAALRKSQMISPALNSKVALTISIFCAGTPTSQGTKALLEAMGVSPDQVYELSYRGYGWPGMTTAKVEGDNNPIHKMAYSQAWGNILSHYGQFRCELCPDSTGEFADISCGDAWHRQATNGDGWSLILIRTHTGKRLFHDALQAGYIKAQPLDPAILPKSQKALLNRRRTIWARLLTMRVMRTPIPRLQGFSLFANWRALNITGKIRLPLSTACRILSKKFLHTTRR